MLFRSLIMKPYTSGEEIGFYRRDLHMSILKMPTKVKRNVLFGIAIRSLTVTDDNVKSIFYGGEPISTVKDAICENT